MAKNHVLRVGLSGHAETIYKHGIDNVHPLLRLALGIFKRERFLRLETNEQLDKLPFLHGCNAYPIFWAYRAYTELGFCLQFG